MLFDVARSTATRLAESPYSLITQNNNESLFSIGNGLFGLRGTYEEKLPYEQRGLFMAGFYGVAGDGKEELVRLPDVSEIGLEAEGERFHLLSKSTERNERFLDLSTRKLIRSAEWRTASGTQIDLEFSRFFSPLDPNRLLQEIRIRSDHDVKIKVRIGIDGEGTNGGYMHFGDLEKRVISGKILHADTALAHDSQKQIHLIMGLRTESGWLPGTFAVSRKKLTGDYTVVCSKAQTLTLIKETGIFPGVVSDAQALDFEGGLRTPLTASGPKETFPFSDWTWTTDPEVDAQLGIARYHVGMMIPSARLGIPAKGLTGEGYRGHMFWDTEIFMLPSLMFTAPAQAKSLLLYRFDRLNSARENARRRGFLGAMVPWESADSGFDQTPDFSAIDIHSGKATPIMSGKKELHVTADVMLAILMYVETTNDTDFLTQHGIEMLEEYARFWLSKAEKTNRGFEIRDVIGPDEYTESIDNNYYTNYLVKRCLNRSLPFLRDQQLKTQIQEFLACLYFPRIEHGLIPQDDTFLSKPVIDLTSYRADPGSQSILKDYSRDQVIAMQVMKQADVVLLFELFPDEFDLETKRVTFAYYEPKTIHDSSLSKATYSIVAFDIGWREMGELYFRDSLRTDVEPRSHSAQGIHAASMFRPFWILFRGILGIRVREDGILVIDPKRQSVVPRFQLTFGFRNRQFTVRYGDLVEIRLQQGESLSIQTPSGLKALNTAGLCLAPR